MNKDVHIYCRAKSRMLEVWGGNGQEGENNIKVGVGEINLKEGKAQPSYIHSTFFIQYFP